MTILARFKIYEQLSHDFLICSVGWEKFFSSSSKKIVFILKTVVSKQHFLYSSLPLVLVRDRQMGFAFL